MKTTATLVMTLTGRILLVMLIAITWSGLAMAFFHGLLPEQVQAVGARIITTLVAAATIKIWWSVLLQHEGLL